LKNLFLKWQSPSGIASMVHDVKGMAQRAWGIAQSVWCMESQWNNLAAAEEIEAIPADMVIFS